MKELEDHLQLVCQMMEDENSNFLSFLRRLKKKSKRLNPLPFPFLQRGKGAAREEEKRP